MSDRNGRSPGETASTTLGLGGGQLHVGGSG
jgi:hypothetical protein